jgi:hypothetical protein
LSATAKGSTIQQYLKPWTHSSDNDASLQVSAMEDTMKPSYQNSTSYLIVPIQTIMTMVAMTIVFMHQAQWTWPAATQPLQMVQHPGGIWV